MVLPAGVTQGGCSVHVRGHRLTSGRCLMFQRTHTVKGLLLNMQAPPQPPLDLSQSTSQHGSFSPQQLGREGDLIEEEAAEAQGVTLQVGATWGRAGGQNTRSKAYALNSPQETRLGGSNLPGGWGPRYLSPFLRP